MPQGYPSGLTPARLLGVFESIADADGLFHLDRAGLAERFNVAKTTIDDKVLRLVERGQVIRVAIGKCRLTGTDTGDFVIGSAGVTTFRGGTPAKPIIDEIARPDLTCSYRTARECGIEPVVRMVASRGSTTSNAGADYIAVTLARIPCLERPLP